jgi:hypothetical protein
MQAIAEIGDGEYADDCNVIKDHCSDQSVRRGAMRMA